MFKQITIKVYKQSTHFKLPQVSLALNNLRLLI